MSAPVVTGQRACQMRVVPAEVLKRLYARSDRHGLVQTAGHLGLLVAGGWLVLATKGTWWVVPALPVQGIFVNSLFGAMHDSLHYGSFKTRQMADELAFFSGDRCDFSQHCSLTSPHSSSSPLVCDLTYETLLSAPLKPCANRDYASRVARTKSSR